MVHVLSRSGAFIDPCRARGYTPGMLADQARPQPGLPSLTIDLPAKVWLAASGGLY